MENVQKDQASAYWPFTKSVKWQANSPRGTYSEVEDSDLDLNELNYPRKDSPKTRIIIALKILASVFFAVSYVALAYYTLIFEKKAACILGNESEPSHIFIFRCI